MNLNRVLQPSDLTTGRLRVDIKKEIDKLKFEIRKLMKRMPPHDPPMSMMIEWDELEVKQDDLKAELKALQEKSK